MNDYLIEYQSSQWCGGGSYVIVRNCVSAEDAVFRAEEHMCFHWKYSDTGEYTPMHVIEDLARKYYRGLRT